MHSEVTRNFVTELENILADWMARLPDPGASAQAWLLALISGPEDVRRASGLPSSEPELAATRAIVESDSPLFRQFRSSLNQRLQIYLGGVDGLARSADLCGPLANHVSKIYALRQMLGNQPRSWPRQPRTLASVAAAVDAGSLRDYRTGEADSDLWIVLKTLQEHWESRRTDLLIRLTRYTADTVIAETHRPGQHIADRRHAWWAARTLYQAVSKGLYSADDTALAAFMNQLLSEPVYVANSVAVSHSLVPEFHERISVGWELINISELLRGWGTLVKHSDFDRLQDREEALMGDVLDDETPVDMRLATVYARAGLTYLSDDCPRLWGKDL